MLGQVKNTNHICMEGTFEIYLLWQLINEIALLAQLCIAVNASTIVTNQSQQNKINLKSESKP